jgi:hypothetical protein
MNKYFHTSPYAGKLSKGEKLMAVDHATVDYPPFRRRFYIEVPEIQRMTEEEVAAARKTEGIKVSRGLWLSSHFDLSEVCRPCWDGPWGQHIWGGTRVGLQVETFTAGRYFPHYC